MPQFVIDEILSEEPYETANGAFVGYQVRFSGAATGEAQHSRKATSPAPVVGETFDGEISHRGDKAFLKRSYNPQGAPNGPRAGGGKSPREKAEIARMNAQGHAVRLLALEVSSGLLSAEELKGVSAKGLLKPRIDWFFNDTKEAGEGL